MQVSDSRGSKALASVIKYCEERQDSKVGLCASCNLEGCLVTGMAITAKPTETKTTVGETYGLWKVTSNPVREGEGNRSVIRVDCVCECGHTASIQYRTLKNGLSTGCKACKCGNRKKV